jgi:5-methylcytosine-specific restriction endonuclease McrA
MPYKNKTEQLAYQLRWLNKHRDEWFAKHGPCVLCGSSKNLQVDHIDPSKKVSHKVWTWAKARREAELKKCQVLCEPCHKSKTKQQLSVPIPHGTHSGYSHHGCRCKSCRSAARDYMRCFRKK